MGTLAIRYDIGDTRYFIRVGPCTTSIKVQKGWVGYETTPGTGR
jgi:hypothetical protein